MHPAVAVAVAVRRTMAHPTAGTTTTGRRRAVRAPTEWVRTQEIPGFVAAWMRQELIALLTRSNNWSIDGSSLDIYGE